jgi:hypothetical protein
LGFLDYVRKIKALGYELLFPDLYSPSSCSPLGNRFYKLFKPILTAAKITEEGLGAHAVRHRFGAQLKKKLSKEDADLWDTVVTSETSGILRTLNSIPLISSEARRGHCTSNHIQTTLVQSRRWRLFSQPSR